MKKQLLLSLFSLFFLAANAQEAVIDYTQSMPVRQPSTLSGFFAPHKSISTKAEASGPTAYYSRPEGLMFFGMSYRGLHARHYAFAPQGVDITYKGVVTGDKAIWNYELEYNPDGSPLTPLTKEFTEADPTLTITYEDGGYYAPELRATVGEGTAAKDSAYSIVLSRIYTRCSTGEIFGSGDEMYDIPVGNYNGRYFGYLDNAYLYAATNNEGSDRRIAEGFGLQAAHIGGFYERMPLMNGASYALYGADVIVYAETEPQKSDIAVEVYETMDGEIIDPEAPLTVMYAGAVTPLYYNDNSLMGYGIRFAAPQAITANGEIMLHIVNTADGQVVGIASTHNKLTFDTVNHKGSLELNYNDGSNKTIKLDDLTGWAKRPGFYELSSPSYSQFSGYVDLNQSSIRYVYTTNDGYRIISTISEIFFLKSENTVVYNDSTPNSSAVNVMYQFDIAPANMTASQI